MRVVKEQGGQLERLEGEELMQPLNTRTLFIAADDQISLLPKKIKDLSVIKSAH
jgi:hypothetical protein